MKKIIAIFIITLLFISCGLKYELYKAIEKKDIPKIKELIDKGAPIDTMAKNGKTALVLAAKLGDIAFLKFLMEKGADVNQQDGMGMTALMEACSYGHLNVVNLLIKNGAVITIKDFAGTTALWRATTKKNNIEVIKILIDLDADVNLVSHFLGSSVLWNAVDNNQPDIVELLIKNGANINFKMESGWSLLAWAKEHKYNEVAEILIKYGAKE